MNNAGEIVGTASNASNVGSTAYLYKNGRFKPIMVSGGTDTFATGINNAGTIVGYEKTPGSQSPAVGSNQVGFIVKKNRVTLLTPAPTFTRYMDGINGLGDAIGTDQGNMSAGDPPLVPETPFIHYRRGIDALLFGSSADATPLAINNARTVVGSISYYMAFTNALTSHAWIFTGPNGNVDLNTLIDPTSDVLLTSANAINARGQIAGVGQKNGTDVAFLLTPRKRNPGH